MALRGMPQTEVTDFVEAARQHMLEEAAHKFMAVTLTQMTPPTTLKLPSSTAMPRSCLSGSDD